MALTIIRNPLKPVINKPIGEVNNQEITITEPIGDVTSENWKRRDSTKKQYTPLSFETIIDGKVLFFKFPQEPIISVSGANNIIERNVAKGGRVQGTIKERWSRGDYQISINGIILGVNEMGSYDDCFPVRIMNDLQQILEAPALLRVENQILNDKGIIYIIIKNYSFPFTKGENAQTFQIEAVSDEYSELLVKI